MTSELRIRCSGEGKRHVDHVYPIEQEAYLLQQSWTKECRPYMTEQRDVGPWRVLGQQVFEADTR